MTTATATADLTVDQIIAKIVDQMATIKTSDSLTVGDQKYAIMTGDGAVAALVGGTPKLNKVGKRSPMMALVAAMESAAGPLAVLIAPKDNGDDEQGFRSVTRFDSTFTQAAGTLGNAGEIKTRKGKGLKYTGQAQQAPSDLVAMLPGKPKPESVKTARATIAYLVAQGFGQDCIDPAMIVDDERERVVSALAVRDAHNAHARVSLVLATVAARWY